MTQDQSLKLLPQAPRWENWLKVDLVFLCLALLLRRSQSSSAEWMSVYEVVEGASFTGHSRAQASGSVPRARVNYAKGRGWSQLYVFVLLSVKVLK